MEAGHDKQRLLIENLPCAFSYHRIITDDSGEPVDYVFLEVNAAFEEMTGLNRELILGRKVTEVLPGIKKDEFDWIGIYGKVALEGRDLNFERYFEPLKRWYDVQAYSDEPGYFITVFSEITARKQEAASLHELHKLTEKMLAADPTGFNYQEIAETLQYLSGAKFTAVNTYEEDRTISVTRAIAGMSELIDKASKVLGFSIAGRSWEIMPERLRKIKGGKLVRFSSLYETAMGSLNQTTSSLLHKLAGIGDIYVIELVPGGQETLGDIIFFMPKNQVIENREAIELYAGQLASLLGRFKSDIALRQKSEELDRYFNNSLDLLCIANTDGEFVRVNKRWQEILGYTAAELEGRSFLDFVHPDDMAATLKAMGDLDAQIEVASFKNRYLCSDGSYRWIEWRSKPQGKLIYAVARDITETVQTEEELKIQRERLSNIVEGANVATWEWNVQTGKHIINDKWAEMIGYKLEDIYKGSIAICHEFTHPVDLEISNQEMEKHFRGEIEFYNVECRRKHKDGHWIWVNDRGKVISWTRDGKPLWVFGTLIDITDRKKVEEELKAKEYQYRSVVDDLTEMVCRFTPEGVLTFVNYAYCRFMGKEEEELIGSNFLAVLPDEARNKIMEQHSNLSPQNPVVTYEHQVVMPNGEIFWQQWVDRAIYDEQGAILEMQGVGRDVTDQKKAEAALQESEEKYRKILETTAEGFYEVDLKGKFVACNRAMAEMLGYREEEVIGMSYKALCKDPDAVFQEFNQAFTRGKSKFSIVMEMIRKDNSIGIADISVSLIYDQEGNINGFRGMGRDITERVKLEEHLKHVSLHDELTGLYNRRYFENELYRLDRSREHPIAIVSADLDGLKLINDTLGHNVGDRYLKAGAELLKNTLRASDILARVGGDEFVLLLPRTGREATEELVARIRRQIDEHNHSKSALPLSISIGLAVNKEGKQPLEETYKQADAAMYRDKLARGKKARSAIISSLLTSLSKRSNLGEGTATLVPELSIKLAQAVNLDNKRLANLKLLSRVYDLGKVNMPDHIIHSSLMSKTAELKEADREAIRRHPEVGYRIASASPDLAEVADLILKHHENYDGSGYPLGLKGEEIPLECRILAIASAYSAMISPRSYAQNRSKKEAIAELKRFSGSQFDPQLINIFTKIIEG